MIILCQRWTADQRIEALCLTPSEGWVAWDLGVVVYTPPAETITTGNPEHARFLGSGDLMSTLRAAFNEMGRWSADPTSCEAVADFIGRCTALMNEMISNLEAQMGSPVT
jgi:hypothetical protein